MALVKLHSTSLPVVEPKHRLLEEGPLVIDYYVTPVAPSMWVAHGEVLRGVPEGLGRDLHPRFTSTGATESEALKALLGELERYLDDPTWEGLPCH